MNTVYSQTSRGLLAYGKIVILILVLSGCATSEPQYKTEVSDFYKLVPLDESQTVQERGGVRIKDFGEVDNLVQPFEVQKCAGAFLAVEEKYYTDIYGQRRVKRTPIYATVDPLQGYYVRKLLFTNNTAHTLPLYGAVFVIVDGSGSDIEHLSKDDLETTIRSTWPCVSGSAIVSSLKSVKLIKQNARVLPGRTWEGYIVFPSLDLSLGGDWRIQYIDIPVKTEESGAVSKRVSFETDLTVKHSRTISKYVKRGFFSPWELVSQETKIVN